MTLARPARAGVPHEIAGDDERLLVRERDTLSRFERGERGVQSGRADDRVQHDVDIVARRGGDRGIGPALPRAIRVGAGIRTIPTNAGANCRACSLRRAALLLAVRAVTRNRSRCRSSTRSAVVPIEPVEPSTATPSGAAAGVTAVPGAAGDPAAETRSASRTAGCRNDREFHHVRE